MADLGDCGNMCVAVNAAGEGVLKITPVGENTSPPDITRMVGVLVEAAAGGTVAHGYVG